MEAIDSAGLPAGVINLVIGEGATAGDAVVVHPDVAAIGFTGSAATGRRIAERGAGKPLLLELGGNGPVIVFEDADLDRPPQPRPAAHSSMPVRSAPRRGVFSRIGRLPKACARNSSPMPKNMCSAIPSTRGPPWGR